MNDFIVPDWVYAGGGGGDIWIKNEVKQHQQHYGVGLIYPICTFAWLTGNG